MEAVNGKWQYKATPQPCSNSAVLGMVTYCVRAGMVPVDELQECPAKNDKPAPQEAVESEKLFE